MTEPVYAAIALAIAATDAGAPEEVLLMPAGEIPTRPSDPRPPWHNTNPAGVLAATRALDQDLVVDFEHQTQRSERNGKPAPASGWIKRVFERGGAIWGGVEWTADAARMIAAKEYRFISPVFHYDRGSRVVQRIMGAALTNEPAFHMPALARAGEGGNMDFLQKLRAALGLGADATEDEIVAAAKAMTEKDATASARAAVDRYAAQGRVSGTMRDAMIDLARRDPDGFEAFANALPAALSGRIPGLDRIPTQGAGAALTGTEIAAARAVGLTDEQYMESR